MKTCLVAVGCMLFLAGCAGSNTPATQTSQAVAWPPAYQEALEDAQNPEPAEVVHNLTAIVPENEALTWREVDGVPHVLMASLVSNTSYYESSLGGPYNTGSYTIWVTAVPEVGTLCRAPDFGEDTRTRLRQLLGLIPTATITAFVEFWVNPEDLFRPAPDNEITDTTAGLILPDDTEPWYRAWFNELRASQYFQSTNPAHNAYPWTQLGYTYDWGRTDSEQGVSEFVIKTNADVLVHTITPLDTYCGRE